MKLKEILKILSVDGKPQQEQQQQNGANTQSDRPRPQPPHHMKLPNFTKPLILDEGGTVPIQRWNIYVPSRYHHESIPKGEIRFRYIHIQMYIKS